MPCGPPVSAPPLAVVHLFTDIEGSTRLWEQQRGVMTAASAAHFELSRQVVQAQRGRWVKPRGDGIHAVFADPLDAVLAMLALQRALVDPGATAGLALKLRCGAHIGADEARDNDFYGPDVNRAARIADAGHGGQMLLSQAVADAVATRLPAGVALRALGAVRLRDLARPEPIHQVLAPPLRQDFPPLRSLEATPNNLPLQISRFIGREAELAALRALVEHNRLVTLFGTGGIGKSRLSLQLGAELLDGFADGVWMVELAPLADAAQVPLALAGVLGIKESATQSLDQALAEHLRERSLLLILDNCEHVLHAAATLAKRLLQAAPRLRVLASSREPLHVGGEAVFPVPSLSAPPLVDGDAPTASALMAHAAVRLFVDRARGAQPAFAVDDVNAAAVADICCRLDGIPLAIELAAARLRALSVQALAERLVDSFKLVSTQDATVAPRQRTLHLLIDWSHALLSTDEQRLFRRLAVFAGGFTLEAAEAVCSDGLVRDDIVDLLTQLVDKSLVLAEADGSRYRMLEPVRLYATERLADAAEQPTRRAHLLYFLTLAEAAQAQAVGPDQGAWLTRLDRERANLLAAHAYSLHADDGAESCLRLSLALRRYWFHLGLWTQRLALVTAALQRSGLPDDLRATGLFDAGQMCCWLGRYDDALRLLNECLGYQRAHGDQLRVAIALQPLGMAAIGLGDRALGRRCCQEAVDILRDLGNPFQLAAALTAMAQLERMDGALERSESLCLEVLTISREHALTEIIGVAQVNLSMLAIAQRRGAEVPPRLTEAIDIAVTLHSKPALASALDVATALAAAGADWPRTAWTAGAAQALMRQTQVQRDAADHAFLQPWLERAQAALPAPLWQRAEASGAGAAFESVVADVRAWLQTLA